MNSFLSAVLVEGLKARRSRVPLFVSLGFTLAPLMAGLFMLIMKDPEKARQMGLLGTKAQLAMTTAEWSSFFGMLMQAVAIGGTVLFSIVTSWVFGREFSDKTVKELLAVPVSREAVVIAKFFVLSIWGYLTILWIYGVGLLTGYFVAIPGFTTPLAFQIFGDILVITGMILLLMTPTAYIASAGRGYLASFGWTFLTIFLSQIIAALGYGSWFPWSVPALFTGVIGPRAQELGVHSYVLIGMTGAAGFILTLFWWRNADQAR